MTFKSIFALQLLIAFFALNVLSAQGEFEITYDHPDERDVYFFSSGENSSGDYIVAGNLVVDNEWNGIIAKYSKSGELKFSIELDSEGSITIKDIVIFDNFFFIVGKETNPQTFAKAAYLGKFDYEGALIFEKQIGGEYFDEFSSIVKSSNGQIIISGSRNINSNYRDGYIGKYDIEGNVIWEQFIDYGTDIQNSAKPVILPDQSIILANYTLFTKKGMVTKYDQNGNQVWEKLYEGNQGYLFSSLLLDSDTNIVISGWQRSVPNYSAVLLKMDIDGNLIWEKNYEYPTLGNDRFNAITQGSDANYYVAGNIAGKNAYFSKINLSGEVIWHNSFGAGESDSFQHMSRISNENFLISGYTRSFNNNQELDGYLIKVGVDGIVPIEEVIVPNDVLNCFPNPAWSEIYFEIPNHMLAQNLALEIFSINGHRVFSDNIVTDNVYRIEINELQEGVYIAKFKSKQQILNSKFTVHKR